MIYAGIYIHIPFCQKKCGYCDFYSETDTTLYNDFIRALIREIQLTGSNFRDFIFDTVYVGGGTPTILPISGLKKIFRTLRNHFAIESTAEITIEANPGTVNREILDELREAGFNRLSMGVQSFDDNDLRFLGRIHTAAVALESFNTARDAGFRNINIDLMTAFPGLNPRCFKKSLDQAVLLQSEHISCYTLIFEPGTPFYTKMRRGQLKTLSSDQEADFYELANKRLTEAGYQAYEISNFAAGKEFICRHNLKYWNHQPYLGLGPSAHSFVLSERWHNISHLYKYLKALEQNRIPVVKREQLDIKTLEFEHIFLHLRLRDGISLADYTQIFKKDFSRTYQQQLTRFIESGMIEKTASHVRLSSRGWLLADEIAESFLN